MAAACKLLSFLALLVLFWLSVHIVDFEVGRFDCH